MVAQLRRGEVTGLALVARLKTTLGLLEEAVEAWDAVVAMAPHHVPWLQGAAGTHTC